MTPRNDKATKNPRGTGKLQHGGGGGRNGGEQPFR